MGTELPNHLLVFSLIFLGSMLSLYILQCLWGQMIKLVFWLNEDTTSAPVQKVMQEDDEKVKEDEGIYFHMDMRL